MPIRILSRLCLFGLVAASTAYSKQAKELGSVQWLRNYDTAVEAAERLDKPILILFQEVPGCQGCVDYGQSTLRHPLIVDAIENAFVPLAIFNNQSGHDRAILKRFEEPAWNFQVMRFVDVNGADLIPRKDRIWTPEATAARMIQALEAASKPVPAYLKSVAWSHRPHDLQTAAFSMFCFWDGEAILGGIDGVIETEAGWLDGHEVVRLRYNPKVIAWPDLVKTAQSHGCARQVYAPTRDALESTPKNINAKRFKESDYRAARSSDQKRHLRFSKLKSVILNPIQGTKINAALRARDPALIRAWLSPSQIETAQL